jgi:mRNA interferase MazF
MVSVNRFDIFWIDLDPTRGKEIKKIKPCVVISPEDVNRYLSTVVIAPITSTVRKYPTRVNCKLQGKDGEIALDQLRAVDKERLNSKIAALSPTTAKEVCNVLQAFFEY